MMITFVHSHIGRSGGVRARIVLAISTLSVLAVFIVLMLQKNAREQEYHRANALMIAEFGLEEALSRLGENPDWTDGITEKTYREGSYTVTVVRETRGDTLHLIVTSTGTSGPHRRAITREFTKPLNADSDVFWQPH